MKDYKIKSYARTKALILILSLVAVSACSHNSSFERDVASEPIVNNYSKKSISDIFEIDRPFSVGEYWIDQYFVATDDLTWAEVSQILYSSNKHQKFLKSINFSHSPKVGDIIYYFNESAVTRNKTFSHTPFAQLKADYAYNKENNVIRMPAMEMKLKTQAQVDAETAQEAKEKAAMESRLFDDRKVSPKNRDSKANSDINNSDHLFDDRKLDTSEHLCKKHWLLSKIFGKKSKNPVSRFIANTVIGHKHISTGLEK